MTVFFNEHRVKLLGSGSTLPGPAIDNQALDVLLKNTVGERTARKAQKISQYFGITSRHWARGSQHATVNNSNIGLEIGIESINKALLSANRSHKNNEIQTLDYLIGHTTSPHTLLPPNIAWIADALGHEGPYMEFRQACCGFANALQTAAALLSSQTELNSVGILGSEVGSLYVDFTQSFLDQEQLINCMQMGDGAGSVILGKDDGSQSQIISDIYLGHIGNGKQPGFGISGGGASHIRCENDFPHFFHHAKDVKAQGAELFKNGLTAMLDRGYKITDFDFILPHQVNGHLAKMFADELGLDPNKIIVDADKLGNLGSAAIWVSLDKLRRSSILKPGHKVLVLGAEATKYIYGGFVYHH